jgi:glycosyltransferase involved in cell wall biosynthesis
MKFTVVTPSFKQLPFLKLNAASVADQRRTGVEVEHIVQDAASPDGTAQWLATRPDVTGISEKDGGMYDAINRGIIRGTGDIFSWLNCDEQYLPGALDTMRAYFEAHPGVDIAVGHTVVVDPDGNYLCHRKAVLPRMPIVRLGRLPVHSSSMFFRSHLVKGPDAQLFDTSWKALGDWEWVRRLILRGAQVGMVDAFLSAFADTGGNLAITPTGMAETKRAKDMLTPFQRITAPIVRMDEYLRKYRSGYYSQAPYDVAIYRPDPTTADGVSTRRRTQHVDKPTFLWKSRVMYQ